MSAQTARRWRPPGRRRDLPPSVERLLRAAIRFERFVSWRGPTWRSALLDDERARARELIDELDEEAGIAEATLRLEGASEVVRHLGELRARIARFRLAVAQAAGETDRGDLGEEVGRAAAAVTGALPDLKDGLLAHLAQLPARMAELAPAAAVARPVARARFAWLSSLEPLSHTAFRWLWLASLASQLGTWIQNVGAVDLMTLLAPTALLLALVQTATTLPGLFLALPAGALADIVDRRRLLLVASTWMCGIAALLTAITFAHQTTWWLLLVLTFGLGVGTVAGLPAWQAIIPDLVPRSGLTPAVTLSSVAINLARAVGPALGGVAVALAGPGASFALTAVTFGFTAVVVLGWRPEATAITLPKERMAAAVWSGIRYSLLSSPVRILLIRAAGFSVFASALWALMPVVSRHLHGGLGYSGLLGSLGVGAVAGALLLPAIRRLLRPDALLLIAGLAFAAVTVSAGQVPVYAAAAVLMAAGGVAWVCAISTFNVAAQRAAPRWMRGRVLACYQLTYTGTLAIGSAAWGAVATRAGAGTTLTVAGVLLAVSAALALALRWRLDAAQSVDPARPAIEALPQAAVRSLPAPARGVLIGAGGYDLTGRRLGAYRLEAPIGDGPLGRVYRARRSELDPERAVKVVQADLAGDPGFPDRFLQGARTAAELHHPNIVPVRDAGTELGLQFVVMDHVESITLAEHLELMPAQRALGDPTVRRCIGEVAAALDYAHARGVAHGDLKASNVLIRTSDRQALLTDFAMARARNLPELTPAGDLRAFAGLLYEIATGDPLPASGAPGPYLPRGLDAVLAQGLAASPMDRYETAGELASAYLDASERSLPAPAARRPAPPARRGLHGGTGRVLAPATAVVLGAGVVLGLTLGGVQRPARPGLAAAPPASRAPVVGVVGEPMAVGGARLTVVSVQLDAPPPEALQLADGDRFVAVQVRYQGGSGPTIVSPYDWALTEASGAVHGAEEDGVGGALEERQLRPAQSASGLLGFAVPRTAQGLVLHFHAELGDGSAEIPLP